MYLTKQAVQQFEQVHLLTIHEQESDWASEFEYAAEVGFDLMTEKKRELAEIKAAVLKVVPERFHTAILDDSIVLPEVDATLRDEYLQWQQAQTEKFEELLNQANENKMQTLPFLRAAAQEVFSEGLHDAVLLKVEQRGKDLTLYFNTTGGFTTKALVLLTFIGVTEQEGALAEGLYYIYDELEKTKAGIAFRLIASSEQQLDIVCETIDAVYYYYPKARYELDESAEALDYLAALNPEAHYFWLGENGVCPVDVAKLSASLEELEAHLYTDIYEDPYAHFSEPLPAEELLAAVISEDIALRIRAWNTMYAEPHIHAEIINTILARVQFADEDDTMQHVFVTHFYNEGVLTPGNIEKYKALL